MACAVVFFGGAFLFTMLEALLLLLLVNTVALGALLFHLPRKAVEPELPQEELEERERPFTVVFSTDLGASARDCFLALEKKDNETIEFFEGAVRRGVR